MKEQFVVCPRLPNKSEYASLCSYCQYCASIQTDSVSCIFPEFYKWYNSKGKTGMDNECYRVVEKMKKQPLFLTQIQITEKEQPGG